MACGYSAEVHSEGGPNESFAQLEQAEKIGEMQEKSDANFHRQYDRQIRLWGLAAQQRMTGGNAHSSNMSEAILHAHRLAETFSDWCSFPI